jgi:hypothetical protein
MGLYEYKTGICGYFCPNALKPVVYIYLSPKCATSSISSKETPFGVNIIFV